MLLFKKMEEDFYIDKSFIKGVSISFENSSLLEESLAMPCGVDLCSNLQHGVNTSCCKFCHAPALLVTMIYA